MIQVFLIAECMWIKCFVCTWIYCIDMKRHVHLCVPNYAEYLMELIETSSCIDQFPALHFKCCKVHQSFSGYGYTMSSLYFSGRCIAMDVEFGTIPSVTKFSAVDSRAAHYQFGLQRWLCDEEEGWPKGV